MDYLDALEKNKKKQIKEKKQQIDSWKQQQTAKNQPTSKNWGIQANIDKNSSSMSTLSQLKKPLTSNNHHSQPKNSSQQILQRQEASNSRYQQVEEMKKEKAEQEKANINRELTEEEKRKFVEVIEMNANIGYMMMHTETQKKVQEYDPLAVKAPKNRYHEDEPSDKNFNLVIEEKMRRTMGVTDDINEIKRKIEEEAKNDKYELQKKAKHAQNLLKTQSNPSRDAEARYLRQKLSEPVAKKQPKVGSSSQSYQRPNKSNNDKQKILRTYDPESRESKPTVNVINVFEKKKASGSAPINQKPIPQRPQQQTQQQSQSKNAAPARVTKLPVERIQSIPQQQQKIMKVPQNTSQQQQRIMKRPHQQNMLGKRDIQQRRQQYECDEFDEDEDDDDSDLSGFIEKDEYDPLDPGKKQQISDFIKKKFGPRGDFRNYDDDSDDSNMEVPYHLQQAEESRAEKIARKEDAEQLRMIQQEEEEERRMRKLKKLEKKRLKGM